MRLKTIQIDDEVINENYFMYTIKNFFQNHVTLFDFRSINK